MTFLETRITNQNVLEVEMYLIVSDFPSVNGPLLSHRTPHFPEREDGRTTTSVSNLQFELERI